MKEKVKRILNKGLRQDFYYICREWPYKNIKPRILMEQYMEDYRSGELNDYKFYCFNGEPQILLTTSVVLKETLF